MPYFDTLAHLKDRVLYSYNDSHNCISLDSTEGNFDVYSCDHCGSNDYPEDELTYCEDVDESRCPDCCGYSDIENRWLGSYTEVRVNNNWETVNENFYDNYHEFGYTILDNGDYVNEDDAYYCQICDATVLNDDTTYSEYLGQDMCNSCYEDAHALCDDCGKVFHNDELSDGLCEDCVTKKKEEE
jgi:predicted RNA-binding protein associated with RNAse of E/G family